jgi:hypothetical protein
LQGDVKLPGAGGQTLCGIPEKFDLAAFRFSPLFTRAFLVKHARPYARGAKQDPDDIAAIAMVPLCLKKPETVTDSATLQLPPGNKLDPTTTIICAWTW